MREPPDNWSGEKVHKDIFHRFHEPSVESISFIGIDPHDDPSSRAAVTRNIPEGGSGIIGVMEDADRIDNIERPLQIHRRDIRFHKRHVWEFFRVTTCACDRIQIDADHFFGIRRDEGDVLTPAAAAIEYGFSAKGIRRIRKDPLGEEPLIVIVGLFPLPGPFRLFLLHRGMRDA